MGSTSDGKVIEEVKVVEVKAEQLWKKGEPDAEGYFTLQNIGEPKVLTAISESSLEIKGMRWILLSSWLFVDYLPCCFLHTDPTQLWEKRNPNNKTCFIVANPATGKVLTATFDGLKAKGNYWHKSHSL